MAMVRCDGGGDDGRYVDCNSSCGDGGRCVDDDGGDGE